MGYVNWLCIVGCFFREVMCFVFYIIIKLNFFNFYYDFLLYFMNDLLFKVIGFRDYKVINGDNLNLCIVEVLNFLDMEKDCGEVLLFKILKLNSLCVILYLFYVFLGYYLF